MSLKAWGGKDDKGGGPMIVMFLSGIGLILLALVASDPWTSPVSRDATVILGAIIVAAASIAEEIRRMRRQ